jgi:signal-transduction protein with cAMP-binding, CBS, and nucleotidyltransferase domain
MSSIFRGGAGRLTLRFALPAFSVILLFLAVIFAIILPVYSRALMQDRKAEARDLTATAASVLERNLELAKGGSITEGEAKARSLDAIRALRYGEAGKDYFWITDTKPVMIEHPYRPELEGTDLSDYRDQAGNRVFLEMVRTALEKGEGYVEYYWQYEDVPGPSAPKISHVRFFKPWGWIVGTGIYVDDVRLHIRKVSIDVWWISGIIALAIGGILFANVRSAARIEESRRRAEEALLVSKERYKVLVESSENGLLMLGSSGILFMNQQAGAYLGYAREELSLESLALAIPGLARYRERLDGAEAAISPEPGEIVAKDGRRRNFLIGAYQFSAGGDEGMILNFHPAHGGDAPTARQGDTRDDLIADLQLALSHLYEPVGAMAPRSISCGPDSPVREAVGICTREGASAILIRGEDGRALGIVTDRDIRERVVAAGKDREAPCREIMSAPLVAVSRDTLLFDALNAMAANGVGHVAVRGADGGIEGFLSMIDLVLRLVDSSSFLLHQIRQAPDEFAIGRVYRRVLTLIRSLSGSGVSAKPIIRLLASLAEEAVRRIVELAIARAGREAPAEFAFMVFGSLARRETLVHTDQDNGIVYENPDSDPAVEAWFLTLGKDICRSLDLAGFRYCPGGTMASEPGFNASLAGWKKRLESLLDAGDPQSLMQWAIAYDMRAVYGSQALAKRLADLRKEILVPRPQRRRALAQLLLEGKVPLDIFGNLPAELKAKEAILPLVNAAKGFALYEGMDEVSTLGRLDRLCATGILAAGDRQALESGFLFLMDMRLGAFKAAFEGDGPHEAPIRVSALDDWQRTLLKKTLVQISLLQSDLANRKAPGEGL